MYRYDFDTRYDRTGTGCYKADGLMMKFGVRDLLSLWVADMDFAVAPEIMAAWQTRMQHPIFGYNFRLQPYYDTIIAWIERRYHWKTEQDWIVNTPGVVSAINAAIVVFSQPGDKILIQTPVYEQFFEAVTTLNRTLVTNPLIYNKCEYSIDFADLDAKLSGCKLFLLCSPHNPVGRVWTEEELRETGRLCKKHNVIVISDEIHADLLFDGRQHIPFAALADFHKFTISCYSPSKSFNLAGMSNSAIIIPDEALRNVYREYIFTMHLYLGNTFGIVALQTAWSECDAWLEALKVYLQGNRDYLCGFFASRNLGINVIPTQGTYLAWLDFCQTGFSDAIIRDKLLIDAKVALNAGSQYGIEGRGFCRLNFGCPRSVLEIACERIDRAFSSDQTHS